MAIQPVTPGDAPANPASCELSFPQDAIDALSKVALDIQGKGYHLNAVLWALDKSIEFSSPDPLIIEALGRATSLCDLATEISADLNTLAEEVEVTLRHLRVAGRAAQ